jgi:hypothetical protein
VVSLADYVHAANNGGLTDDLVLAFVEGDQTLRANVIDTLSGMGDTGRWYAVALDRANESEAAHREDRMNRLRRALWGPEVSAILFDGDPLNPINLPETFWDQSEILQHIRQMAWHRMLSGDAVLGAVMCRLAWRVWPDITLPPVVAAPGTLDLCVALVGPSGSGKTSAMWAASELLGAPTLPSGRPHPAFEEWPAGSGEGIIEAYLDEIEEEDDDGNKHRVKSQTKLGVLFSLDEGAALRSIAARSGATIMQTIRSAWSGSMLGNANARADTTRRLAARSYRFVLLSAFQPGAAAMLLGADETEGGTPQRWQWLSLTDPRTPGPLDTPDHPGPLDMCGPIGLEPGDKLTVDGEIEHEIRVRRHAKVTGAAPPDPLNEHRDLARLKVAALMSILHGRSHVDHWAWRMSGYLMTTSEAVRARIIELSAEQAHAKIDELRERAAATALTIDEARESRSLEAGVAAVVRHVQRVDKDCGPPHTVRCITQGITSKLRKSIEVQDAIDLAYQRGWVIREGAGWR